MADFPYNISPRDLSDPTLSRVNRALRYIWDTFQKLIGNGSTISFLRADGTYSTPIGSNPPQHFGDPGTPGQVETDSSGNLYVCYSANRWAKFTPTSTTF